MEQMKKCFKRFRERYHAFRYKGILGVTAIFALIAVVLFVERSGIRFNYAKRSLDLLPATAVVSKAEAGKDLPKNTVVFYDGSNATDATSVEQFHVLFSDMKVGCDFIDLSLGIPVDLAQYDKAVFVMSDLSPLGEGILSLCEWVYDGGNAMFPLTLDKNAYSSVLESKLGMVEAAPAYVVPKAIYLADGFMVGGNRSFEIPDAYESARAVRLDPEKVKVYAYTDDESRVPLIWEASYGKGKFVVDNFGVCEKVTRGFFAASFSLLGDYCVYPVINGSTFYLDDFPSQIPSGNSAYIQRDFNTSIRDFYVNIWWPDMMNFADQYGLRYTGLAIECYDENVDGELNPEPDKGTFLNFGNMLLRQGGEIGYHGYNHQPLCFDNCDYRGYYDYKTWKSYGAMKKAFDTLVDFCEELFPEIEMGVYVPPSNILSDEGRALLRKEYPQIHTISGIYFAGDEIDFYCAQEFDVAKDGIVDQPRIISGCYMDSFTQLAAVSELNFHFVNSHFTHPDDALDPERGAELGWTALAEHFDGYLSWLYDAAPMIRNFKGSEMSAAVERFAAVNVTAEETEDKLVLTIGNFHDEAQFFVRFNDWDAQAVAGGTLECITGNLYLLSASEATVTIAKK